MTNATIDLFLPDEAATQALARTMAPWMKCGDIILLSGGIGAGKSCFARAMIRQRLGADTEVPSPTFTLVQTYDDTDVPIWHADLYRLSNPAEVVELGLLDACDTAFCLVEWPERAGNVWPATALKIAFSLHGEGRRIHISGDTLLLHRLQLYG
jgi:tRNA threonylcarbamoyladenosine biosynthesis protein TsaE